MVTTTHENGFGPRKTVVILAVVAGCFAVLWPKIFYPMLMASYAPPPTADSTGCCDVIFESDVTAVDIMQELCHNIIRHHQVDPRVRDAIETRSSSKYGNHNNNKQLSPSSASLCRDEVLARCGIDLSSFLADKERLKKSYKQVLEEIRGFNGSFCLKMQFGVPLSRLGTPHLIRYHILMPHSTIRQERSTPPHAGNYHPALRERGRAIPSSHIVPKIQDRPDHVQPIKMRPPMGAGHVVSAPKGGNGTMGILMPLYTVGIVLFFIYTISKVLMGIIMPLYTIGNLVSLLYKVLQLLRKSSDSEIMRPEYSTAAAEREYQKLVFNPEAFAAAVTASSKTVHHRHDDNKERRSPTPEEPAPSIDELKEHQTAQSNGLTAAGVSPDAKESVVPKETYDQDEQELEEFHEAAQTVKVVNMEMTASCEGGKRSRPSTPILVTPHSQPEEREKTPPVSIYLEGALPPQCELLVTDSKTQEIVDDEEDNMEVPIVLSGKMTLSLISLDQEESQDDNDDELEATGNGERSSRNSQRNTDDKSEEDRQEEEEDSYESGSEEASEDQVSDEDDDLDSNTDVANYKKKSVRDTEKPQSSKESTKNSDGEDSETDDYRHDYERNAALLESIQREKSRRLEQMERDDSEEEDEVEGDEEEEGSDVEEEEEEEEVEESEQEGEQIEEGDEETEEEQTDDEETIESEDEQQQQQNNNKQSKSATSLKSKK